MVMVIYWANKNDPNGATSSQTHPNIATRRPERKKKLFLKKKFIGAITFVGPDSSEKSN